MTQLYWLSVTQKVVPICCLSVFFNFASYNSICYFIFQIISFVPVLHGTITIVPTVNCFKKHRF